MASVRWEPSGFRLGCGSGSPLGALLAALVSPMLVMLDGDTDHEGVRVRVERGHKPDKPIGCPQSHNGERGQHGVLRLLRKREHH